VKDRSQDGTVVMKARRRVLWEEQHGFCWHCARYVPSRKSTIEHIRPQSSHGTDEYHNVVMSCRKCNLQRGTKKMPPKTPERLAAVIARGIERQRAGV